MAHYLQSYDKNRKRIGILVDACDITRTRRINADYSLTFTVPMTSADFRDKLPLKGHVMDERGQYYVINSRQRKREDRKLTAQVSCSHVMFKLADYKFPYASYIAEAYGVPISQLTALIQAATGGRFTLSVEDTFDLVDIKDFGRGNCLEALNTVLSIYGAEVEPDNFTILLRKKIGKQSDPFQYRIGKNVVSTSFTDNGASVCTRLFCEMKDSTTWIGQPASLLSEDERALLGTVPGAITADGKLAVNYLVSPYSAYWASESVPYYDDVLTEQDITDPLKLLEAARKRLREREVPALELSIEAADLHKLPYSVELPPGLGDAVTLHDPELEAVGITARITEIAEYPYEAARSTQVTVANVMARDYTQIIADLETSRRAIDNVFSGGRIRADVFEEFAKQAVIDVNASKTEVKYDFRGILLMEKANPLRQVVMSAAGIVVSTDGGQTARTAITANGIAAELVTGQLGNFVSMEIGSGNNVVKINTNGLSAGHSVYSSAPFRVDMAGNVVANKLTANSASIANSTFSSGSIVGSSINVGNGVFTVDPSGNMFANNATLRGLIYALGGTFSGDITATGRIIGGTIQGAVISGGRIESDTSISVTTDLRVGRNITLEGSGDKTILFSGSGNITFKDSSGMIIAANTFIEMNTSIINISGDVNLKSFSALKTYDGTRLSDVLATKASAGKQTGTYGPYDCGIPIGAMVTTASGSYQWKGMPVHTHAQV